MAKGVTQIARSGDAIKKDRSGKVIEINGVKVSRDPEPSATVKKATESSKGGK